MSLNPGACNSEAADKSAEIGKGERVGISPSYGVCGQKEQVKDFKKQIQVVRLAF